MSVGALVKPLAWALAFAAAGAGRLRPWRLHALSHIVDARSVAREARLVATRPYPELPPGDDAWTAGREPDGTVHVVFGPMRLDARGARLTAADDRPGRDILAAVPVARGWVFATGDGTVTRAETFTGPLRVLGTLPCGVVVERETAGRLVARDDGGAWWTTDGQQAPERLPLPMPAMAVAFLDRHRGVAVLEGGSVVRTADDGRTWDATDLGSEAAWDVTATPTGLRIATTGGMQIVRADGVLTPAEDVTPARREIWEGDYVALRLAARVHATKVHGPACVDALLRDEAPSRVQAHARFFCEAGVAVRAPLALPGHPLRQMYAGSVTGVARAAVDLTHRTVSVAWRGRDADGPYSGVVHGRPYTAAPGAVIAQGALPSSVWLIGATRAGAMVVRTGEPSSWLWVPTGGDLRRVPALWGSGNFAELTTAPTRDWGMAIAAQTQGTGAATNRPEATAFSTAWRGTSNVQFTVMEVRGFDGTRRARRALAHSVSVPIEGLAWYHDTWGLALDSPADPGIPQFYPAGGGGPMDLPRLPAHDLHACSRAMPAGSAVLVQPFDVSLFEGPARPRAEDYVSRVTATVELTTEGACVRGVRGSRGNAAVYLEAAAGDRLVGTEDDGETVRRVRCAWTAESPRPVSQ